MKTTLAAFSLLVLFLGGGTLMAQDPEFKEGVYVYDGALPLEVDRHSNPFVVDWNNDGLKDLLVGQFTQGYIWLYLNQGTDLNPVFNGGTQLQSGGSPITTTYG